MKPNWEARSCLIAVLHDWSPHGNLLANIIQYFMGFLAAAAAAEDWVGGSAPV